MANQQVPLIIENEQNNNNNNTLDGGGSEILLTNFNKNNNNNDYSSTDNSKNILLPGQSLMTREDVPLNPIWVYILYYSFMFLMPIGLIFLSYEYVDNPEDYIIGMISLGISIFLMGWIIGSVFYNCLGMPANYTRKIGHLGGFLFPILFAGGINALEEDGFGGGTFDYDQAFENIIFDVLWAAWGSQVFIFVMMRPSRAVGNYLCGKTTSNRKLRWINCCENTMDAFERPEDRPNHLLWLNTQLILWYFFLLCLSFWWNDLDSGVMILIPAFIGGLGDGLAEPVGVKFGANGCYTGKDCRYKTHGCCTSHDYTRSIPGSAMVLLSGYLGVGLTYNDWTTWQFVIAMIIIPPLGMIVEAKAPHTLDNPFIALIVGVVATLILYIPW